jgi:hypothetical protein
LKFHCISFNKFHSIFLTKYFSCNIPSSLEQLFIYIHFQVIKFPWSFRFVLPVFFKLFPDHFFTVELNLTSELYIFASDNWCISIVEHNIAKSPHLVAIYTLMLFSVNLLDSTYSLAAWT